MIETLVALNVTDEAGYAEYRRGMTPLLEAIGGSFGYDFRVSEVLISPASEGINRVFTIRFPTPEARDGFFSDPAYLAIREQHFDRSVAQTVRIATWDSGGES